MALAKLDVRRAGVAGLEGYCADRAKIRRSGVVSRGCSVILEIDALSFTTRAAQVAAGEIFGMLEHGEISPVADWFRISEVVLEPDQVQLQVDLMAEYVIGRRCSGETLFHHVHAQAGYLWPEQSYARRVAFELFASTVASVGSKLLDEQAKAEQALELATRPEPAPVAIEDTIFEPEESLDAELPHAKEAQQHVAAYDQLRKAEARARQKAADATRRAQEAREERDRLTQQLAATPPPPATMSIGEAPPAAPVNRGGRGKKKAD